MSDTDSFIDEVTEEVRRDRLYRNIRRYGWIAVVAVLAIVGGTAWNEWRKAQETAAAQQFGDAILAAVDGPVDMPRGQLLGEITANPEALPLQKLLLAAVAEGDQDAKSVVAALEGISGNIDVSVVYRDLAALKIVLLGPEAVPASIRTDLINQMIIPGAPYRLLGLEQQVLMLVEQGDTEAAVTAAQSLLQETGVTAGLQQRLGQLIVTLGAEPENLNGPTICSPQQARNKGQSGETAYLDCTTGHGGPACRLRSGRAPVTRRTL